MKIELIILIVCTLGKTHLTLQTPQRMALGPTWWVLLVVLFISWRILIPCDSQSDKLASPLSVSTLKALIELGS